MIVSTTSAKALASMDSELRICVDAYPAGVNQSARAISATNRQFSASE